MVCDKSPQAQVNVDVRCLLCPRHGAPYRCHWPRGYAVLVDRLLEWLAADQAIWEEVGEAPDGGVSAVGAALRARPFCCRIPADELRAIYLESGIGEGVRRCRQCRRLAPGTRCRVATLWGRVLRYRHLCFDCVLDRAARPCLEPAAR
jgi:hypothetical protein